MEEKKKFHWITCKSWNGYFKDLGIKSDTVNEENMQNCIYFEDKEKAECFLCKLKLFIQKNYPKAGEENWYLE